VALDGRLDAQELLRELSQKEAEVAALRLQLRERTQQESAGACGGELETERPMAIVVPMVGLGNAFAQAGFRYPKPLVNIVGRPVLLWLLDRLEPKPGDLVLLAVPAIMERQHGVSKILAREYPALTMRVVILPFETRGWVETILAVSRQMTAKELRMPLVTLDCSTIYHGYNLLGRARELPEGAGASVYFDTQSANLMSMGAVAAQFSYLKLDEGNAITDIREKSVISPYANTGAYIFKSAKAFKAAAEDILSAPEEAAKTGLYASILISSMLAKGDSFVGLQVKQSQFAIVATPRQLEAFIWRVSNGEVVMRRKMRFCFDLEATLVSDTPGGGFEHCEPIPQAIALVRQLHAAGHRIIITTSAGMDKGGVDVAIAEMGYSTFGMLKKFAIPYHEVHFGKPHADVYIDSRSLNGQADVERDLGWYTTQQSHEADEFAAIEGAIDARAFNLVRAAGTSRVIKSSTADILRGENHWYRSIPSGLKDLFPEPFEIVDGDEATNQMSSITMSKVAGVTFSHLATSRLLMQVWVRKLVRSLHRIHTQAAEIGSPGALEARATPEELCSNYANKVRKRTEKHKELYDSLGVEIGIDTGKMAECIINFMEDFEANQKTQWAQFIHGDPVFSNIIRTDDDGIILIDMRGEIGKRLTTQGDIHYDLSKVYQSLCGYDFMLLDQSLDEATSEIFDGLRAAYWQEVSELYPDISHRNVRLHTASHFFAIVPLHEVRSRMVRYLKTSHSMLLVEGLMS